MRFILGFLLLAAFPCINANDVSDYLREYSKTGVSDYSLEKIIISNNDLEKLVNKLTPFYNDTLSSVRQKAYYLTYKKAILSNTGLSGATNILLKGCNDKDGGIIDQNLRFLKNFHREDFNDEATQLINSKLSNHRIPHYKDYVLLAGFLGTGKDVLYQKFLDQNISSKIKWYISLALGRMDNPEQLKFCVSKSKALPVNDQLIDYVIPDLIYLRQKDAIDFCIVILNNNEKLCHSQNPENSESINCGYRIIEMLANVVVDLPLTVDNTGIVYNGNYEDLLNRVRQWFVDNPDYQIKKDTF